MLRKRIALTMRLDESAVKNDSKSDRTLSARPRGNMQREARNSRGNNAMGNAFADALKIGKITSYRAKLFALFYRFPFPKSIAKTAIFAIISPNFYLQKNEINYVRNDQ